MNRRLFASLLGIIPLVLLLLISPNSDVRGLQLFSTSTMTMNEEMSITSKFDTEDILVTAIATGHYHTCALTSSSGVKCWGGNFRGQLGDGSVTDRLTPVDVSGLTSGVQAIATGSFDTCALTSSSGVKCWGLNSSGQLGDGSVTDRLTPVDVSGLTSGVQAIATGADHTCALTSSGGVKCWGSNASGQLGDNSATDRLTPVDVSGLTSGVQAIAAGGVHTCALTSSGGVKCWGSNFRGQLGDGSVTNRVTPVDVSGLTSGVQAIAADAHTCALTSSGGVKCWGWNSNGQLGDGSVTNRVTPVDVSGLTSGVQAIAAGGRYTCALTSSSGVKCWGLNFRGQLGDGSVTDRVTPVDVSGLTSGVQAIATGEQHTCAVTSSSGVKCWGANDRGQLGDNSVTARLTPVDVVGFGEEIPTATSTPTNTPTPTPSPTNTSTPTSTPTNTPVPPTNVTLGTIIILAEPSDEHHNNSHNRSFYEDLFQSVKSYYIENSMGYVTLNLTEIYDNGGSWYKLSKTHKEYAAKPLDFVREAEQVALGTTVIPRDTIVLVVHAGHSTQSGTRKVDLNSGNYIFTQTWQPPNSPQGNEIIISEHDPLGALVHEIGHDLGTLLVNSPARHINAGGWDVMAGGNLNGGLLCGLTGIPGTTPITPLLCDGSNPPHMSSYTKEFLKFLKYQRVNLGVSGTYLVNLLPKKTFGDFVLQYVVTQRTDGTPEQYYVIETRNNSNRYSQWDTSVPSTGVVLYFVDMKGQSIAQGVDQVAVLAPPGFLQRTEYYDPEHRVNFEVLKEHAEGENYAIELEIKTPAPDPIWYAGVILQSSGTVAADVAPWQPLGVPQQYPQFEPDLDLHVYFDSGRHIGMNYATMEYEVQVDGVMTSGNLPNGQEWILFPTGLNDAPAYNYTYTVRSVATDKFLHDNPDVAAHTDGIDSYNVYAIFSDPATEFFKSSSQQVTIERGANLQHSVSVLPNRTEAPIEVAPAVSVTLPVDLAVFASGPKEVSADKIVTYSLIFGNSGGAPATGVNLRIRKPDNTEFVSAPDFTSIGNNEYGYYVEKMDVADATQVIFSVRVISGLVGGSTIQLDASISDDGTHGVDGVFANNRWTVFSVVNSNNMNLFLPNITHK